MKATYLLAVAFLEMIRFSCNGGLLSADSQSETPRSAFSCVFEYLMTPNLMPAVIQCLKAIVHRAFETFVAWMVIFGALIDVIFFFLNCAVMSYPVAYPCIICSDCCMLKS